MLLDRGAISESWLLSCARLSTMRRCCLFLDFFPIFPSVVHLNTGNVNALSAGVNTRERSRYRRLLTPRR